VNHSKTEGAGVLVLLLTVEALALISPASSILQFSQIIFSRGSIAIGYVVTVDPGTEIGVNSLSLGFQLDADIGRWRSSSTLRGLAQDANFKLVRFFEHRMGKPCTYWNESTKIGTWDWSKIDDLVRKVFAIGAEPLIVLGFYSWTYNSLTSAPSGMSTNPNTGLPYPDQWGAYCASWVRHFKEFDLPVRYYEIINEPHHYFGWGGSDTAKLGYFKDIFNAAARAMRAENRNILLGNDNSMVRANSLNKWMATNLDPLDFLSWHRYITGDKTESNSSLINKAETDEGCTYGHGAIIDQARQDYFNTRGKWLPVIQSEANLNYAYSGGTDPRQQTMLNAVTTALSIRMMILKGTVTHNIFFFFAGSGSDNNFGMVNIDNNKPWPPYYAQKMIAENLAVGDKVVRSQSSTSDISTLAWIHNGTLTILLICKVTETRTIHLDGVAGTLTSLRLDNQNPDIQTGNLDVGEALTVNGYTLILLRSAG